MGTHELFLAVAWALAAGAASAQDLEVRLSPLSPGYRKFHPKPEEPFSVVLGAFRFTADGTAAQIDGVVLTALGTADYTYDLDSVDGIQMWLEDGDGIYDPLVDIQLTSMGGAYPTMTHMFPTPVVVPPNEFVDLWVVLSIIGYPTDGPHRSFAVSIVYPAHVIAPGSVVSKGLPTPTTNEILVWPRKRQTGSPNYNCAASPGSCGLPVPYLLPLAALVFARLRRRLRVEAPFAATGAGP